MDLSNDTRLYGQYSWEWSPGSTGRAQFYCASTGGGSHGYWSGGGGSLPSPNWSSAVDKRTFAPGTTDAVALENPSSNLTIGRACHKGISAPIHGYFIGGAKGSPTSDLLSAVDKITNATDTVSRVPGADLPSVNQRKHMLATTGNSSVGYILGGVSPISSASAKIAFATDSTSQSPGSNAIIARSYNNGSSSGTACYWFGGVTIPGVSVPYTTSNSTSNFEKTTIATDTNSSVGNIPDQGNQQMAVTGNETATYTFGYGTPAGGSGNTSYKMPYSNETMSPSPGTNLYSGKSAASAFCPRNGGITSIPTGSRERWFDGLTSGGSGVEFDGSDYLQIASSSDLSSGTNDFTFEAWVYSNSGTSGSAQCIYDNRSGTGSNTTGIFLGRMSAHSGKVETYSAGGYRNANGAAFTENEWHHVAVVRESNVIKLYLDGTQSGDSYSTSNNYSNTTARIGSGVGGADKWQGKISNVRFIKGTALYTSNFDRPTTALTNISNTKLLCCQSSSSTTTKEQGPTITAVGDPTVFTDTTLPINPPPTATPTASTTILRSIGSVPNTGYFGAGDPGNNNSIKRFNFANETTSTIPATVSQSRELTAGTSSITYGYFSGGQSPKYSITDRVQYSNDTSSRIPGANTTTAIAGAMGSGTRTFGILLGGEPSSDESSLVQKLTFASETFANDGNLSEGAKSSAVVTQPQQKAYLSVGQVAAGDNRSEVEKYTFSTSTTSSAPNSIRALKYQTGTGSLTAGYVTGGPLGGGAGESAVDKLTYSTETWSTLSTTMSAGKYLAGGLNNTTVGVFCGGIPSTGGSTTQRVTFSTDTVARIPGADWASNWYRINGAGAQMNSAYASIPNTI
tara:strand:- start:44 stop:2602 length:2559 start_codon:yes stop_codon:yes gene_type:complete